MVVSAQNLNDNIVYQNPPQEIVDLIDVQGVPITSLSPSREWMVLLPSPTLPSLELLTQEELKLAGIRFNPKTYGASRGVYFSSMTFKNVVTQKEFPLKGLPKNAKISNASWSPDAQKIAFTITKNNGIELWVADVVTAKAKKLTNAILNNTIPGSPYTWFSDAKTLLFKAKVNNGNAAPKKNARPIGPIVQESNGTSAPVRTLQDLLKNEYDENLFEYYTTCQLYTLSIETAEAKAFANTGIVSLFTTSPDSNYVAIAVIKKPYSYLVALDRFPFELNMYDKNGQKIAPIADIPLNENLPIGFNAVRTGKRRFEWRADAPATYCWVEAQDGGDPRKDADVRDQLFMLDAPFDGEAKASITFKIRFGGLTWGNDNSAIAYESWFQTRQLITTLWSPKDKNNEKTILFDRSYEDAYNDPGSFELRQNQYGRYVLQTTADDTSLILFGDGASPDGDRPFVDKLNLETKKITRLWRSEAPFFEKPIDFIDTEKGILLTRRESKTAVPNYFLRNLNEDTLTQITFYENPYKALDGVKKEIIYYKRADGLDLQGTLYLPALYDVEKNGTLPIFMWAYPREFKSMQTAAQVSDSPYTFSRPSYASPMLWVTQGYAIFDDFATPIIGEGKNEPNETFVEQLQMNAAAAVEKLVEMGISDGKRIGVGGHSYGAFMVANLLAHTDFFAAGIARSGAYNRTLTPFGFQSEERTLWETPDTYMKMSPFMFADKIKSPILLIHGEADNNSGTFPMQSERFYAALKGHGANVRYVVLPYESHGYQARESVMHTLWETGEWLDKYVKNKQ